MENNNKKIIIGVIVLIIVIISLWFYLKQSNVITSKVVAKVGSTSISEKDIAYEFGIQHAYSNQTITGEEALQVLVMEAKEYEVAKANNILPMNADIINFKDHADKTTKAPEMLKAIKDVFGSDTVSYDRIYILPKIVNPTLHTFFSNNKDLNKEALSLIGKAQEETSSGKDFESIAKKYGLQYATSTVSSVPQGLPPAMQKYFSAKDMPKSKILQIVEKLKVGETYKETIEDDYSYSIVRLISGEKGVYKIESIVSKKSDYDSWYKEQVEKIHVENLDEKKTEKD